MFVTAVCTATMALAADPTATRPADRAATPLQPYTAFAINFPGPTPHVKVMYPVTIHTNPGIAAREIMRMGKGVRVVLAGDAAAGVLDHPDDVCLTPDRQPTEFQSVWPAAGPEVAARRFDAWLSHFAKAGGDVDLLVLDAEDDYAIWNMPQERLAAITHDPRFGELSKKLGFADARQAMPHRATKAGEPIRWNAVMSGIVAAARRRAVFDPLARHFPNAAMCNFNDVVIAEAHTAMGVQGQPWYTIGGVTGTHQSPALFGGAALRQIEADWSRPYLQLVYAVNFVRSLSRSGTTPQLPWVAFKSMAPGNGRDAGFGGGDMYEEAVWHILLSGGTDNLLYFNPVQPPDVPPGVKLPHFATAADADALNALLSAMQKQAGEQRIAAPVTVDPVRYDAPFLLSAARLQDGSTLCRVTFAENTGAASIRVGGEVVRLERPNGKLGVWLRIP